MRGVEGLGEGCSGAGTLFSHFLSPRERPHSSGTTHVPRPRTSVPPGLPGPDGDDEMEEVFMARRPGRACGFPAMTALLTGTASGVPGRYQLAGRKTEAREGEGSPEDASLRARGFRETEASFLPFRQTRGN